MAYIDDINSGVPTNAEDAELGAGRIRDFKVDVKGSFPSLGQAAVNKTAAEINDLATLTGTEELTNKTLTSPVFSVGAVDTADIADNAITSDKILDGAVDTNELSVGEQMTQANVNGIIAGSSVDDVGTLAFLRVQNIGVGYVAGEEAAGSLLRYSNCAGSSTGGTPTGTWRCQGESTTGSNSAATTLWLKTAP